MRAGDDLKDAFAWKEERRLSQALTPQYDNVIFVLEPSEPAKAAIGKYVTVFDYPDGRLSIRHNGVELAYRTFDRRHRREKATIDHLVDRVFEPEPREQHQQPGITENGASVEGQVRKEWDPRKGGLRSFDQRANAAGVE